MTGESPASATPLPQAPAYTIIRYFLAVVFIVYGLTKLLGGQFNYGDWSIDKQTVDGTSLVWSFYGYSPVYGRFIGLTELIPAILLLIPRTATVGAIALFMVALNVTVMDFAYGFPSVKYFALLYTILLGVLLWADRDRLLRLVAPRPRATVKRSSTKRRLAYAGAALFLIFAANVLAVSLDRGPEAEAERYLQTRMPSGAQITLLRSRYYWMGGVGRSATIDFLVAQPGRSDTVQVQAHRSSGFSPWRMDGSSMAVLQMVPR